MPRLPLHRFRHLLSWLGLGLGLGLGLDLPEPLPPGLGLGLGLGLGFGLESRWLTLTRTCPSRFHQQLDEAQVRTK